MCKSTLQLYSINVTGISQKVCVTQNEITAPTEAEVACLHRQTVKVTPASV